MKRKKSQGSARLRAPEDSRPRASEDSRQLAPSGTRPFATVLPAPSAPQTALVELFGLFSAGRHADMELAARALTARHPGDGQCWKALGVALMAQRKNAIDALQNAVRLLPSDAEVAANLGALFAAQADWAQSAECYRRALSLRPDFAQAHGSLADVLCHLNRWQEAEICGRKAVALQPGLAAAHVNLGHALKGQGRVDDALRSYRQALVLSPELAEAHVALGLAFKERGDRLAAAASLRTAVKLRPAHAPSHDQLGVVLHGLGALDEALTHLERAAALQPASAAAHFHAGNVLSDLGRHAEAAARLRTAVQLQPEQAELRVNLGAALLAADRSDEAVAVLRETVARHPALAVAQGNLGNALMTQGHYLQAQVHLEQAVSLSPDEALPHSNLAHLLKSIGQIDQAIAQAGQALSLDPHQPALHSEWLFLQNYRHRADAHAQAALDAARRFGQTVQELAQPLAVGWPPASPDQCLRVGLISGDLRQHPVGYFLESLLQALAQHHAGRIEVVLYANHGQVDALSKRLQSLCRQWRRVDTMDDAHLAGCIRSDGIHVLIDLAGHTAHNRLPVLAWRPAPLQLSWLGYAATTGLAAVDAYLADPWLVPQACEAEFLEPVVRLPESFLCFTPPPYDLLPAHRADRRTSGLRLGCFNQLAKINEQVIKTWVRILQALPGSTLSLQAAAFCDAGVVAQWIARFESAGLDGRRLSLQPAQAREAYLASYRDIDFALDPFPYPGGTTTVEALWMGVPVLTLAGDCALARQGSSILNNLGLVDAVARDTDDYVARALRWGRDPDALWALKSGLRERLLASPLCNAPRFALHFEQCLRALWAQRCQAAPVGA
jgi:protein O-GlcNAc transferase